MSLRIAFTSDILTGQQTKCVICHFVLVHLMTGYALFCSSIQ